MKKMNFLKREGCICGTLEVDDIQEIDMTDEQRLKVLDVMYNYIKHNLQGFNSILEAFIHEYGEYKCDDEPCDCCGDYVCEWNLKVKCNDNII